MNIYDSVYGNIYLISNILSNVVELETVVEMNRSRHAKGEEKITDQVTKLDLKWSQRDFLPLFKNLEELVIHIDTNDETIRAYESAIDEIVNDNEKLTSLSIFASSEVSLRSYMLPSRWYELEYLNFGDTVAYRKKTNTFIVVDDPFHHRLVRRFVFSDAIFSVRERAESGGLSYVNLILYTNNLLELAMRRRDEYRTILVHPLEGSKYADYAAMADAYYDENKENERYINVNLEDFEFLGKMLFIANGITQYRGRNLSIEKGKSSDKKLVKFIKQISTNPDIDKIIVSYDIYSLIANATRDESDSKQLDLVKKISKYIPIALTALELLKPSVIESLIKKNIVDLEYTSKLYTYLPYYLHIEQKVRSVIDRYPAFREQIIDLYPEYEIQLL